MRPLIRPGILATGIFALLVAISPVPAEAGSEKERFAEEGLRLSILFPRVTVRGEFDGRTIHVHPNTTLMLPEIDPVWGRGLSVGVREKQFSLELNYQQSKHNGTLPGGRATDAKLQTVNVDFKYYFLTDKRVQPFILLGWVPYARMTVQDASVGISGATDKGIFISALTGANLGLGFELFLTKRLSLCAGGYYRRLTFEEGKPLGEWGKLKDEAHGFNILTGVSYIF